MKTDLKDKVVIITGASTGLGKALAFRLSRDNANLIIHARTAEKLQEVERQIKDQGGICSAFSCDLTSIRQPGNLVEFVTEAYGRVDVLVNIAGIWHEGPTEKHPKQKVLEMFKVNAVGVIYMIQEILPMMKSQKSGHIFNVISDAGVEPSANWGIYAATKHAVHGFTNSLKLELAKTGIKVTGFYPAGMNTDLFSSSGFRRENEPWMMDINDVAEIIAFILKQPEDIKMDHVEVRKFLK